MNSLPSPELVLEIHSRNVCMCRFGGALDGAAQQFTEAYDSNLIPMEFVNTMRKQHKLIMGIGHKVKSVSGRVM